MSSFAEKTLRDQQVRKQLTNELRGHHFAFGFQKSMTNESTHKQHYKEHDLKGVGEVKQEMEHLRSDLRSTHYILGLDDSKNLFRTTAKEIFKEPVNPQRSQLSQETKNDLRSHHFNLGNEVGEKKTDYKLNYDKKVIDPEIYKSRQEQINFLRKHNHEFGDVKPYYNTMYGQSFNAPFDKQFLKQGKSKDEIQKQIVELRKTNLSIGNDPSKFQTEAQSEYQDHGYAKARLLKSDLASTNYQLGTDDNDYSTQCKATYQGKQLAQHDPNKIKDLSKDLRAEHFDVGYDEGTKQSMYAATHKEFDKNDLGKQPDMSYLYRNHFEVGGPSTDIDKDTRYKSMYKELYDEKKRVNNQGSRNDRSDRASNILIGTDKPKDQFLSESKLNYKQHNGQPGKLEEGLKKDLRTHHYEFGTDPNDFTTTSKATFYDKSKQLQSAKLEEALKNDLRRNHFVYGNQNIDWTTSQNEIGQLQGPPAALDKHLAIDLKSHHYKNGTYDQQYSTEYGDRFTDFTK